MFGVRGLLWGKRERGGMSGGEFAGCVTHAVLREGDIPDILFIRLFFCVRNMYFDFVLKET